MPIEFGPTGNSVIRSAVADRQNPSLEPNMEWIIG